MNGLQAEVLMLAQARMIGWKENPNENANSECLAFDAPVAGSTEPITIGCTVSSEEEKKSGAERRSLVL